MSESFPARLLPTALLMGAGDLLLANLLQECQLLSQWFWGSEQLQEASHQYTPVIACGGSHNSCCRICEVISPNYILSVSFYVCISTGRINHIFEFESLNRHSLSLVELCPTCLGKGDTVIKDKTWRRKKTLL